MNRFQSEFDKRLKEFHELQTQLLEKIGVEQPKPAPKKSVKTTPKKATKATPKTKQAAKPVAKKTTAKKAPAKKTTPTKTVSKAKIADINGVGPATVKKLSEAGIKELSQIANPSAQEKKTLEAFNKVKGFSSWQEQANKLIQA
jgi:predicted flap endonuclease-1-like 5' DNA nuclease